MHNERQRAHPPVDHFEKALGVSEGEKFAHHALVPVRLNLKGPQVIGRVDAFFRVAVVRMAVVAMIVTVVMVVVVRVTVVVMVICVVMLMRGL